MTSATGARTLRSRLFVIATLSIAIAATTVIFSFVNALVLEPLPMAEPDRVVLVLGSSDSEARTREPIPVADFNAWREHATCFEELAGSIGPTTSSLSTPDGPFPLANRRVTANFARAWGLNAALGRTLREGDGELAATPVAVLSHGAWTRRFGADPGVLGRALVLDGVSHTVVGVMPERLEIGDLALTEVWTPLRLEGVSSDTKLQVTALLGRNVTASRADAELRALVERRERTRDDASDFRVRVLPFDEAMAVPETWLVLGLAGLAVFLVVLVACASVASLLLARASDRRRETAVKLALGASRARIVAPALAESATLALAAGAAGLVLARAGLVVVRSLAAHPFFQHQVELDLRVAAFVLALSLATPLLFGLGPALHQSKLAVGDALRAGARGLSASPRTRLLREALVVAQIGFALALLVVCFATVRATERLDRAELGFDADDAFVIRVDLPEVRYREASRIDSFHEELLAKLSGVAGVRVAAATSRLPIVDRGTRLPLDVSGRHDLDRAWVTPASVSPAYFPALGIDVLSGRPFASRETAGVAILNEEAANRFFGGRERAVASRVRLRAYPSESSWLDVVGVVESVRGSAEDSSPEPEIYLPLSLRPARRVSFVIRASEQDASIPRAAREALRGVDPELAPSKLVPFRDALDESLANDRLVAALFSAFALVALLLASAGLYAVMEHSVAQRVSELALSMVLGARPVDVLTRVVRRGVGLAAWGIVLGLPLALFMAGLVGSAVPGVGATSPSVFAWVAVLLGFVAGAASLLPALRAVGVDLAAAMRAD